MPVDEQTMTLLRRRAEELADAAAPLTSEQALLLVSLYARYPVSGDGSAARRGVA
jgi:hypothetical protein